MKNKILPILFVLGFYSAYSQVSIGKKDINPSSQLEVFAADKGVLFPRVALTGLTDASTIISGNVNSLFVFNTETTLDLKPGYYFWYIDKWNKIATSDEIISVANTAADKGVPGDKGESGYPGSNIIVYTDTETGIVYVQKPDGTWVKINGINGIDGKNGSDGNDGNDGNDGKGITSAQIDTNGDLLLTYTDGNIDNAGKVKGDAGEKGETGEKGEKGDTGLDGKGGETQGSTTIKVEGLGTAETPYIVSAIAKDLSTDNTNDILNIVQGAGATLVDAKINLVKGPINTYLATDEKGVLKWNYNPWLTRGNLGTNPNTDFIGTRDNNDLIFKRNNIRSGLLSGDSTSFGVSSLNPASTGANNAAFGANALRVNTVGELNTAVGADALKSNTLGKWNTAIGYGALSFNTTGQQNTAIGTKVLFNNGSGSANIGIGINTMNGNVSGNDNIGVGNYATNLNQTGSGNIAFGTNALRFSDVGNNNIAIGTDSGTHVGATGGALNTLVDNSIFIGVDTRVPSLGNTNQIVIGNNAVGRGSNTFQLGNTQITGVYTSGSMTASAFLTSSDKRLKKNINDSSFGLNFITKLRPVTYFMNNETANLKSGFIAQEVEAVANSLNYEFSGVSKPSSADNFYSLNYSTFVVPLVKAVQEQQNIIENQDKKINDLEARLKRLETLLNK